MELNENAPKEQIRVTLQLSGHLLVGVTKVHRTQVQAVYGKVFNFAFLWILDDLFSFPTNKKIDSIIYAEI